MSYCNRPLSNCVRTEEGSRGWEDRFGFFFVCTKEVANLSSQPRLCSFVFAKFKSGLLMWLWVVLKQLLDPTTQIWRQSQWWEVNRTTFAYKERMWTGVFKKPLQCQETIKGVATLYLQGDKDVGLLRHQLPVFIVQRSRALNKYAHGSKVLDRLAAWKDHFVLNAKDRNPKWFNN